MPQRTGLPKSEWVNWLLLPRKTSLNHETLDNREMTMSNTLRTFLAPTADEALAQVRREMGLDADVVEVREVPIRGLFAWLSSRKQFEVKARKNSGTVASRQQSTPAARLQPRSSVPTNQGTVAAAANRKPGSSSSLPVVPAATTEKSSTNDLAPPPPLLPEQDATRNLAGTAPVNTVAGSAVTSNRIPVGRLPASPDRTVPSSPVAAAKPIPTAAAWQSLGIDIARGMQSARDTVAGLQVDSNPPPVQTIEQRLDALQQMIADLGRRTEARGMVDIPPELFPHYLTLVEADVEPDLARELIHRVHRHSTPGQTQDTAAAMALLTALLEQRITCGRSLAPVSGRRQIAMVVGPTGVGKTTTLAKLAGGLGVEQGYRIGLITIDTYRVAAVEQLRTYAEIIDLPMRIVANAAEMQEALDAFIDCDLVLIDTAGRSPHDERRLAELKQLIDAANPDHVYLVLSLASGANALRSAAECFSAVGPTSLVVTKLDEATGCGGLVSISRDIGLPISYFTTGQEVPRDIEPANPCRAARLIVGTDTIHRPGRN
jgi:flagellar biosynthesis protein FlhF